MFHVEQWSGSGAGWGWLGSMFHVEQAGLSVILKRIRTFPQGLKPTVFCGVCGTDESVPFQSFARM
jgi:hypothetical protein